MVLEWRPKPDSVCCRSNKELKVFDDNLSTGPPEVFPGKIERTCGVSNRGKRCGVPSGDFGPKHWGLLPGNYVYYAGGHGAGTNSAPGKSGFSSRNSGNVRSVVWEWNPFYENVAGR